MTDHWRDHAACRDMPTSMFFEDIFHAGGIEQKPLRSARRVCWKCPVRQACLDACMEDEKDAWSASYRFGLRALLTPNQRDALANGAHRVCPCGGLYDPGDYLTGQLRCPDCGGQQAVNPLSDGGPRWVDTSKAPIPQLLRLFKTWPDQDWAPSPAEAARQLHLGEKAVRRAYDKLLDAGFLAAEGGGRGRRSGWFLTPAARAAIIEVPA